MAERSQNNFDQDPMVAKDLARFQNLMNVNRIWQPGWQEQADYVLPRKNSIQVIRLPGVKRTQRLYDSTALDACELLSASMHGTLTSAHMRWFFLELDDPALNAIQNVKEWTEEVSLRMNNEFNRSNFHSEVQEFYTELVGFGTGLLLLEEKPKIKGQFGGLQFTAIGISKYCLAEGPDGLVNTVFHAFPMSNLSIIEEWGEANVPIEIVQSEKPEDMQEVIHCVYPSNNKGPLAKKWTSNHILTKGKFLLSSEGFYDFPFMATRWSKNADETYGRGPTDNAMPDVRSLNKIVELELKAMAKVVDPPMYNVGGDVIGAARLVPAGMTTVRSKDAIGPILTGIDFKVSNLKKEELRTSIKSVYKIDQLQLPSGGPQMTATETNVRYELMQRILGPTLGRLEIEFAKPLIDRTFNLMWRANALPDLPPELQAAASQRPINLRIRYEGPLARAQKASDVQSIGQFNGMLEPLAKAKPEIMDVIDFDEMVRKLADELGIPASIVRDSKAVEILRQAQQQKMQEAQQGQQQAQMADSAGKAAPFIKAAGVRPEPGSPLEKMQNGSGRAAA